MAGGIDELDLSMLKVRLSPLTAIATPPSYSFLVWHVLRFALCYNKDEHILQKFNVLIGRVLMRCNRAMSNVSTFD